MNNTVKRLAQQAELINGVWAVPDFILQRYTDSVVKEVLRVQAELVSQHGANGYHLDSPTKAHFGVI